MDLYCDPAKGGPEMGAGTVLVVDDERKIREVVRDYLEHAGYTVLLAESGRRAEHIAAQRCPDLVILDLLLPDVAGEEVARRLREASDVPIIFLTAKAAEEDRVQGLRGGADDYVVKPFSARELVARTEAVLRRARGGQPHDRLAFEGGRLEIRREEREAVLDGAPVPLTRTEFDLLWTLATHPRRVFSRQQLLTRLQGYDHDVYERTVDAHVKNLRRKLGEVGARGILTVVGVGYKFVASADA